MSLQMVLIHSVVSGPALNPATWALYFCRRFQQLDEAGSMQAPSSEPPHPRTNYHYHVNVRPVASLHHHHNHHRSWNHFATAPCSCSSRSLYVTSWRSSLNVIMIEKAGISQRSCPLRAGLMFELTFLRPYNYCVSAACVR